MPAGSAGGLAAALAPSARGQRGHLGGVCHVRGRPHGHRRRAHDRATGCTCSRCSPIETPTAWPTTWCRTPRLWFLHHHLFDLARRPRFDHHFARAWEAYREFNELFAQVVDAAAAEGATVLVQDYHLSLLPGVLAEKRPDLHTVHFTHTPFASPDILRVLPTPVARELLEGMAGATACGFHTARWEDGFRGCCEDMGVDMHRTFVSPLTPDSDHLARAGRLARSAGPPASGSTSCSGAGAWCCASTGSSRRRTCCGGSGPSTRCCACVPSSGARSCSWPWPTRHARRCRSTSPTAPRSSTPARRVNDTWGTDDWAPIILDVADDPGRSIAALMRYDVLLVNPLRDGLNLVAKEGPHREHHRRGPGAVARGGRVRRVAARGPRDQPLRRDRDRGGAPPGPRHGAARAGPSGPGAAHAGLRRASPGTGWPTSWRR